MPCCWVDPIGGDALSDPATRMKLLSALHDKLKVQQTHCLLVGLQLDGDALAVDLVNVVDDSVFDAIHEILPHGMSYVGVWASNQQAAQQLLQEQKQHLGRAMHMSNDSRHTAGILAYRSDDGSLAVHSVTLGTSSLDSQTGDAVTPTLVQNSSDMPVAWLQEAGLHVIRCRVALQLLVYSASDGQAGPSQAEAISCAFQQLEQQLLDPRLVFVVTSSVDGKQLLAAQSSSSTIADVASTPQSPSEACPVLQPSSQGATAAPLFEYQAIGGPNGRHLTQHSCQLRLEVLAYVQAGQALGGLGAAVLQPALLAQLHACRAAMLKHGKLVQLMPHHFLPPGRSHHVAVIYPTLKANPDANEAALAPHRRQLHALLGLPMDRPALRASSALSWQPQDGLPQDKGTGSTQERLRDVHLGLPPPGSDGTVHLLQGSFDYHHYMQDRFDDSGWGCAYRSLQTICSWFRLQQYTPKPSPNHKEIQQILVRLGDKDKSFVGSSQWIGAIELSYILDDYLGVTSKIITVNRGSDIPSHARELAAHFRNQGTPIMIGGGVLAYTLLGVYFNESTGDCAFLILDPHYTGGENLQRIHKGTWVGWKRPGDMAAAGGPLFVQDAFYNFLCPQRPNEV